MGVAVGVGVSVGSGVSVGVAVCVGVDVGLAVGVKVAVGVGLGVAVGIGVEVRVGVADTVTVGVAVGNTAMGVAVGIGPHAASNKVLKHITISKALIIPAPLPDKQPNGPELSRCDRGGRRASEARRGSSRLEREVRLAISF